MNVPVRLGGFALALAVVFAGAYGVGAVAGPVGGIDPGAHEMQEDAMLDHGKMSGSGPGPGGLAVSADGFTLRQVGPDPVAGVAGEYAFQILDASRAPLNRYQVSHDKELHLIVVRRDLTGFQHVHPRRAPDGTWRARLTLAQAGDWRVFADFRPEGRDRQVILGVDVPVAGLYQPRPLPDATSTAVVDGYTVTVDGRLTAGRTSRLTLTVLKDGTSVTDLQPYLGAYGHLVALRAGDLAYLHVHPQETDRAGPVITFDVEVPTTGAYRLFLDFQHGDVVRTASFTATAA